MTHATLALLTQILESFALLVMSMRRKVGRNLPLVYNPDAVSMWNEWLTRNAGLDSTKIKGIKSWGPAGLGIRMSSCARAGAEPKDDQLRVWLPWA